MKKCLCILLSCALLLMLCACGRTGRDDDGRSAPTAEPQPSVQPAAEAVTDAGSAAEQPSPFPLAAAPFSFDESAEMLNFNSRGCARLVENMYYTCRTLPEGGCALASFEMIDGNLLHFTVLVDGCGGEYLTLRDGRLYCLGPDGRPISLLPDGSDRRTELGEPCRSMQALDNGFAYLLGDGTLLAVTASGSETLLQGCEYAYVFARGIFYISAADGALHFFDDLARTDTVLFDESLSSAPLVVDGTLFCAASDGRILALDLQSGERRECDAFARLGAVSFTYDASFGWAAQTHDGGMQLTLPFSSMFDAAPNVLRADGERRVCRGFDGELRTDELFGADGVSRGFSLVLPYGMELPY